MVIKDDYYSDVESYIFLLYVGNMAGFQKHFPQSKEEYNLFLKVAFQKNNYLRY